MIERLVNEKEFQDYLRGALNAFMMVCADASRKKGFHDSELVIKHTCNLEGRERRWLDDAILQAELARQMSEIGEAVEALRKPGPDHHLPQYSNFLVEEADVVIRIGDTLGSRGLPLGDAIVDKLIYNYSRERMHGKKS